MKGLVDLLTCDKSIWLYPNGFCLVDRGSSLRQRFFRYADGDILSVKAAEFFPALSDTAEAEVVVGNEPPVIVPKELYHEEDAMKFVTLQYDASKIACHFSCDMETYKLMFFLYQNEQNALSRLSCGKRYTSYWDLIYRYIHREQHPQNLIWVAEHEQYLDICVERKAKTVLLNRFDYVKPEDELYHVLNVRQQFHMGDAEVRILSENQRSPFKTLAKKYLVNYSWTD